MNWIEEITLFDVNLIEWKTVVLIPTLLDFSVILRMNTFSTNYVLGSLHEKHTNKQFQISVHIFDVKHWTTFGLILEEGHRHFWQRR